MYFVSTSFRKHTLSYIIHRKKNTAKILNIQLVKSLKTTKFEEKESREVFILQCTTILQYNLKTEARCKKIMAKQQRNNFKGHIVRKRKMA